MEGTVEFTNGIIETMDILHYHEVELGIIAYLNGNGLMEIIGKCIMKQFILRIQREFMLLNYNHIVLQMAECFKKQKCL
mgnify:CR=1 FL=1